MMTTHNGSGDPQFAVETEKQDTRRAGASVTPLRKVRDVLVSRAVALFEKDPARRWTVDELARTLGTSRAVLAKRFVSELGRPPSKVLRHVRMQRAAELLVTTDAGLAAIADAVGYDSEFAFSRAFFIQHGTRPGQFRKQAGSLETPLCLAA